MRRPGYTPNPGYPARRAATIKALRDQQALLRAELPHALNPDDAAYCRNAIRQLGRRAARLEREAAL